MNSFKKNKLVLLIISLMFLTSGVYAEPYDGFKEGDSREHVEKILGQSSDPEKDISNHVKQTISNGLKQTNNKNSVYFSIWKIDEKMYYVIGFDEKNYVAVKHRMYFSY